MIVPAKWTEADVLAIRACIAGKASEEQQRRAMDWIMAQACKVHDLSYQPGEQPFATTFAEGRRYPATLIRAMLTPEALAVGIANDKKPKAEIAPRRLPQKPSRGPRL